LFDANDQEMIDSSRYGTEIKFTNHDANRPNCFARVCVVDGDHRVGIFARRDIEAGEEITFDYQMKNVPSWYTEASKTTSKKRKVDDN
jgi:SET domain-containing protein